MPIVPILFHKPFIENSTLQESFLRFLKIRKGFWYTPVQLSLRGKAKLTGLFKELHFPNESIYNNPYLIWIFYK
jgi:hypothetical protein